MRFDAPTSPDEKFLKEAFNDFRRAIYPPVETVVPSADDPGSGIEGFSDHVFFALRGRVVYDIERWLLGKVANDGAKWHGNVRVINALRTGIEDGTITLTSKDDLNLVHLITDGKLFLMSQVVEYYVETGEFMDLMTALKKVAYRTPSTPDKFYEFNRFRMFRLYEYDMESDADRAMLPLEIRLNFSGFENDTMTGEEHERDRAQAYVLDHTKPSALAHLEGEEL